MSIAGILLVCLGACAAILALIFIIVPIFKGIAWLIEALFKGIGLLIRHVYEFVSGMLGDSIRFVGSIIAMVVLMPLMLLNVVLGRWSAAGHFGKSIKRECGVGSACIYRVALQRPLRLVLLDGLLEGVEQRVNEAMLAAPTSDKPHRRTGQFDGYTIVGSLPGGGSGAKLYIAEPDAQKLARNDAMPQRVVIKSFMLSDGSSLPQIVRESRALEAAKQLGLVLEHSMDNHRFFYVMPYHEGDHLGIITRQLHGSSGAKGLGKRELGNVFSYIDDLLQTLHAYHRGGLWHKDVKPENIIIHDGTAHIVDLGLVTPLRSAMTLTTHGTEYFRDPEMVRMALRGVKVHQVDGAKFDVYAVGAVLYFVCENTFPAHGALSNFTKRSPEALRWIVRRAMADYAKRYETAEQMLADVQHVAAAHDPFAVKLASLPSMRGGAAPPIPAASEVAHEQVIGSAGSPRPPADESGDRVKMWGVAASIPGGVQVGSIELDENGPIKPAAAASAGRRPRLKVTNWWTGAYAVQDVGEPATPAATPTPAAATPADPHVPRDASRSFRREVAALRDQTDTLRQQVQAHTMTARRAAREQIKAARARAAEIRRRVHQRGTPRHQTRAVFARSNGKVQQRTPAVGYVVLFALVFGTFWLMRGGRDRTTFVSVSSEIGQGTHVLSSGALTEIPIAPRHGDSRRLLLINDLAATGKEIAERVRELTDAHRDNGWIVVDDDLDAEVKVRVLLPAGDLDLDESTLWRLNDTIEALNLGGILLFRQGVGEGEPHERIDTEVFSPYDLEVDRVTIYGVVDEDDGC